MRPDVVVERHDHVARADRRGGGQPARPEAVHPQHVAVPPEGQPPRLRGGRGRVVALARELREQVLHARAARRLAVGPPPQLSSSARSASSATRGAGSFTV